MTIDALSDDRDDLFTFANWALETGLWDGRHVSRDNVAEFVCDVRKRIAELLIDKDPLGQFAAQLAWLGSDPQDRAQLTEEIRALGLRPDNAAIIQAGFLKKVRRFWEDHKVACIVGAVLAVGVVAAVALAICSASAATSGAVALGSAALDSLANKSGDKPDPNPAPSPFPTQSATQQIPSQPIVGSLPPPTSESIALAPSTSLALDEKTTLLPDGVIRNGQYTSFHEMVTQSYKEQLYPLPTYAPMLGQELRPSPSGGGSGIPPMPALPEFDPTLYAFGNPRPQDFFGSVPEEVPDCNLSDEAASLYWITLNKSPLQDILEPFDPTPVPDDVPTKKNRIQEALELIKRGFLGLESFDPLSIPDRLTSFPERPKSRSFTIEGEQIGRLYITDVNGMNTSFERAVEQAKYFQGFTPNLSIDLVYNCTHGPAIDLTEIFCLNYPGRSPNVEENLIEKWTNFHKQNLDAPNAKAIHRCYSQGAIGAYNSLEKCPPEVRNRMIVIALAPAKVIPKSLCYAAYNFATENDIVPLGELVFAALKAAVTPFQRAQILEEAFKNHEGLIILEPHPDFTGVEKEHDASNPAFIKPMKDIIDDYLNHNGEYP